MIPATLRLGALDIRDVKGKVAVPFFSPPPFFSLISIPPAIRRGHKNNLAFIIYFVKKTIIAYSITPGIGLVIFKLFDILAEIRIFL